MNPTPLLVPARSPGSARAGRSRGFEAQLARMTPEERQEFEQDLGITGSQRDEVLRRSCPSGPDDLFHGRRERGAHLDDAHRRHGPRSRRQHPQRPGRGFIRAEVMTVSDLVRLGSEREVKAHNLVRQEPKDYVVSDDDILNIRFSV